MTSKTQNAQYLENGKRYSKTDRNLEPHRSFYNHICNLSKSNLKVMYSNDHVTLKIKKCSLSQKLLEIDRISEFRLPYNRFESQRDLKIGICSLYRKIIRDGVKRTEIWNSIVLPRNTYEIYKILQIFSSWIQIPTSKRKMLVILKSKSQSETDRNWNSKGFCRITYEIYDMTSKA